MKVVAVVVVSFFSRRFGSEPDRKRDGQEGMLLVLCGFSLAAFLFFLL